MALFAGAAPARVARGFSPGTAEGIRSFGKAKRCILVYLLGGPPQIDMWDMKPLAPAEIRGPFKPVALGRARHALLRAPAAAGRPGWRPGHPALGDVSQ